MDVSKSSRTELLGSRFVVGSERMPGLDAKGHWVQKPKDGPTGRSKKRNGFGLDRYRGRCQPG